MVTAVGQLSGLAQIANLVGGSKTKSSQSSTGSQTSQTLLSQDAMDRLLNQILAGTGGVKSIAGATKGAGLYNSSTEQLLQDDLAVRAAGEVAARSAPTTTTSSQTTTGTQEAPGIGIGGLLKGVGTMGALSAATPLLKGLFGGATDAVTGAGASTAIDAGVRGATGALGSALGSSTNVIGAAMGNGLSFVDGGADPIGAIANLVGSGASNIGIGADVTSAGADIFGGGAAGGVPIGGILSGLLNGTDGLSAEGLGMSAMMPLLLGAGPLAPFIAPLALLGGSIFGNASIICTALQTRGLLDKELYEKGQEYIRNVSPQTKKGYYVWACGVAKKIEAGNHWAICITLPLAIGRTKLLATKGTLLDHIKHPLGTLTKFIGEPACWLIGAFVAVPTMVEQGD